MKLTPREPTPEMVEAAQQLLGIDGKLYSKTEVTAIWKDMHDAAPSVPSLEQELLDSLANLCRRAINEANGLTNYVDERPELHGAEKRIAKIEQEFRAAIARAKGE